MIRRQVHKETIRLVVEEGAYDLILSGLSIPNLPAGTPALALPEPARVVVLFVDILPSNKYWNIFPAFISICHGIYQDAVDATRVIIVVRLHRLQSELILKRRRG